ncbi:hypothetical protein ACFRKB_35750 [Streptomyces scopuliridis]|uniref:hypothetical protein n=1 Tax=Streptomyces scopuliridis TaxID=452529 RepID=UPI00368AD2D7
MASTSEFRRSVRTRGAAFRRTYAVTLGYLGVTQIASRSVEEACATWGGVLDAMEEGIYSGRARQAAVDMRHPVFRTVVVASRRSPTWTRGLPRISPE